MNRRNFLSSTLATSAVLIIPNKWAHAQSRQTSLRVLSEGAPNSLETISVGGNRNAIQVTWNVYDRLVAFAYKSHGNGIFYYDYFDIRGELAESYEVSADKKSITFRLRKNATFHDGTQVSAADVKWSLDRIVASPIGKSQFSTGSMTDPAQFVIVDDYTIRVELPQPDRFALPNFALTYPIIVNSKLAKQHATTTDPFAMDWLKNNVAGGGPFKVEQAAMGERILFVRNDDWKSGQLPRFNRVLWQTVPAAETRVASLIKGDSDLVQDLPPKDVVGLIKNAAVKIVGVPTSNFQFIGMNGDLAPFNDRKVRQAIAYALPYRDMMSTAIFDRGEPLFGGKPGAPDTTTFPQPLGYSTDLVKAKALLKEAGLGNGFSTTFSYELSMATVAEPIALLLQEALGKIDIKVTIEKVPGGQLGTLLQEKKIPFYFEASTSYLADPDYFFRVFYFGNTRWNFGSYKNPEFIELVNKTRYETDKAVYDADIKRMITLVKEDIPIILLWHPALDTGMGKDVDGYSYTFHRQLDFRSLNRTK